MKDVGEKLTTPHERLSRFYFGKNPTNLVQNVLPVLLKYRPSIVITQVETLYMTHWLLRLLQPVFGYRMIAWSHGVINSEMHHPFVPGNGKVRLWIFRHVHAILVYSDARKKLVEKHLPPANTPVFTAWNSTDTNDLFSYRDSLRKEGVARVRERIGYTNKYNLLFISRLDRRKRLDILVEAFDKVLESGLDVALHVIGDGEMMPWLLEQAGKRKALLAHGRIEGTQAKGDHLFAADLSVMPGDVGLSIVDSFSFGTPFITLARTPDGPFHGPELDYLRPGKNGSIVDGGASELAEEIVDLLKAEPTLKQMSLEAERTAREGCSIERMMEGFEAAIKSVGPGGKTQYA
ncbi:glycosyltransferase family 4 protein [bacterium]|nr:glycosyltransferase family 4 protein [bacterium]